MSALNFTVEIESDFAGETAISFCNSKHPKEYDLCLHAFKNKLRVLSHVSLTPALIGLALPYLNYFAQNKQLPTELLEESR